MTETTSDDFFPGFAWAVPRVFADPLSACRFVLGDTLYSRPEAYSEAWEKAGRRGQAVQVLEPSKGIGATSAGVENSALQEAWQQEVLFERHDLAAGKMRQVRTTQGRLYTLLWKGDDTVLDPEQSAPPVPLNAGTFKKHLEVAAARLPNTDTVRFLMATDTAADLQREKLQKVRIALEEGFGVQPELIPAAELDLDAEFLPTVMLVLFDLGGADSEAVTEALQNVLYKPSAGRTTTGNRFRLASHGLLVHPGGE